MRIRHQSVGELGDVVPRRDSFSCIALSSQEIIRVGAKISERSAVWRVIVQLTHSAVLATESTSCESVVVTKREQRISGAGCRTAQFSFSDRSVGHQRTVYTIASHAVDVHGSSFRRTEASRSGSRGAHIGPVPISQPINRWSRKDVEVID